MIQTYKKYFCRDLIPFTVDTGQCKHRQTPITFDSAPQVKDQSKAEKMSAIIISEIYYLFFEKEGTPQKTKDLVESRVENSFESLAFYPMPTLSQCNANPNKSRFEGFFFLRS